MPRQRLAYKKKGKEWRKETVDSIDTRYSSSHGSDGIRNSHREKRINQNLFEGTVDPADMALYTNPYGIKGLETNPNIAHHNIIVPKLNVLIGEEGKRQFDYSVVVTSPNAISKKIEDKKNAVANKLLGAIQNEFAPQMQKLAEAKKQGQDVSQQEQELQAKMQEEMKRIQKYAKYSWKDMREFSANQLLKHYSMEQRFDRMFNDGFKDALILGEEIYQVGILSNEPRVEKLNPHHVYTVKSGKSSKIEDADIIILEDWWSPGRILDEFYQDLKPKEIDQITEEGSGSTESLDMDDAFVSRLRPDYAGSSNSMNNVEEIIDLAGVDHEMGSNIYDGEGNVRVLRVYWRSQRKILSVKYYDEDGGAQTKIMGEQYELDEARGEEADALWINEWWEGTKIAKDIYVNMRPRPIQYNKLENPSMGSPGIIGELYNTNQGKVVSMVTRAKSYQYLYDAVWDRLLKAIAKNMGKILEVDVAKIPANWDVGQWFHYATTMGVGFVDSFKEGNKGAATGKLAGGMNTTGKVLDVETGNYIQAQIQLLEYIKQELSDLVGISKQREGQVSNRETVGGVERSVMQSSHITEWWFAKHEDTKIRVLQTFMDTAKIALKGSTKKLQYLLDDMSIETFILDGEDFAESDYGVLVTSNNYTRELKQKLDGLAQAGLQNQLLKFSDLLYLYSSNSIADITRKIETTEAEKEQQDQQGNEQQAKEREQAMKLAQQEKEREEARLDQELELAGAKIANERFKIDSDVALRSAELRLQYEANNAETDVDTDEEKPLERDKLNETVRHNKATETIAKQKPKPTTTK